MNEEEYKQMRSIVDLGCVNITRDNIVHMNRKAYEHKEQERDLYKEVIEEVREVIDTYKYVENDDGMYEPILDGYDIQKLLQILDKAKENK